MWWDVSWSSTAASRVFDKESSSVLEQDEEEPGASRMGSAHPRDTLPSTHLHKYLLLLVPVVDKDKDQDRGDIWSFIKSNILYTEARIFVEVKSWKTSTGNFSF